MKKIILKSYIDALRYMHREDLQLTTTWSTSDIAHVAGQSIGFGEV